MLQEGELHYFRTVLSQQVEQLVGKAHRTIATLTASGEKLTDSLDQATL